MPDLSEVRIPDDEGEVIVLSGLLAFGCGNLFVHSNIPRLEPFRVNRAGRDVTATH